MLTQGTQTRWENSAQLWLDDWLSPSLRGVWWNGGSGHLHGDVGEVSPPSGGVLLGLESGIGRGTGRATGGGGGSKKEPGILLWPLPFGCRRHKQGEEYGHARHPTNGKNNADSIKKKKKKKGKKSNGGWLVVESVERETTKRMVNVCLLLFMKECVCVHVCVSTSPQAQTGAVEELEKTKMGDFRQKVRKK